MQFGAGVRLVHFRLGQEALQRHSQGAFHLLALSINFVNIELPSWRHPARIQVSGFKAELKQRQLPQVGPQHTLKALMSSFFGQAAIEPFGAVRGRRKASLYVQHVAAKERRRQELQSDQALKAAKLEAVDRLLWQTDFLHQESTAQPSSNGLSFLYHDGSAEYSYPVRVCVLRKRSARH